jgi:hypothetical protein
MAKDKPAGSRGKAVTHVRDSRSGQFVKSEHTKSRRATTVVERGYQPVHTSGRPPKGGTGESPPKKK